MNYKISVVFSTRKIDNNFVEHVKKTCMYKGVEVLPYENNGEYSLTEIYNKGLNEASSDVVIFCHDDILFETKNWGEKILKALKKTLNMVFLVLLEPIT
jgi:glycosyltransferase involved in cell wall biosynthesis